MKSFLKGIFLSCIILLAVAACATTPSRTFSFSFGSVGEQENQGIEILNYRYGDGKTLPTSPPDWALATGHIGQMTNVYGTFPPGDTLFVKWRIESTGRVYENTVDLKDRLPSDMTNQRVHFLVKGSQLYVYLISKQGMALEAPDCPVKLYHHNRCTELYPEHWQNF